MSRTRTMALTAMLGCVMLAGVASRTERQGSTRYGVGRPATPAEIAAWDIDVNPSGEGLPAGQGTAVEGARVFAAKCAGCHGVRGEGLPVAPALVGREPREGFPFGQSVQHVKTVGNYWPYATTLYDYINRAMPFATPGALPPDDVYSVVAFLLVENGIVDSTLVKVRLNLTLQRLQGYDPCRLLLVPHIVRHPFRRQRIRPRRVLEREHAVILHGLGQRERLIEVVRILTWKTNNHIGR